MGECNEFYQSVAAHRGGAMGYQNSFDAFYKAAKSGVKAVEFDVWVTKGNNLDNKIEHGVPIIIHGGPNGEIEHRSEEFCINENCLIKNLTFKQVQNIKLPNGEHIPSFEQFIDEFKETFNMIVDFKDDNQVSCEILLNLILDKMYDQSSDILQSVKNVEIFSVYTHQIDTLSSLIKNKLDQRILNRNRYPKVGYCFWDNNSFLKNKTWHKYPKIELAYSCINPDIVKYIQNKCGMEINAFFMPYEEESIDAYTRLISMEVDCIETDRPLELIAHLNQILSSQNSN